MNAAILKSLEQRWQGTGVTVDSVSLQQITPPKSVTDADAAAQHAQIKVSTQKNLLEATLVSAQQQVVEAKAKDTLSTSWTTNVPKQNDIDPHSKPAASGSVVVVPEGFGGSANVTVVDRATHRGSCNGAPDRIRRGALHGRRRG